MNSKILVTTACFVVATLDGQTAGRAVFRETILAGQQFAHYIEFPSEFQKASEGRSRFLFDHYAFRTSAASPDVLLLAACKFDVPSDRKLLEMESEICSPNVFAIDTTHSYTAREATRDEWDRSLPIIGLMEMGDPYRRTLEEEYKKPPALRPQPVGPDVRKMQYEGYKYRGKTYVRRGEWITSLHFGNSADGKLVVLGGVDKRTLPKRAFLIGDAVNGGDYGTYTIDIFDGDATQRLAAIDVACDVNVIYGLKHASLVNSRWFAIALDAYLRKMVLFDFKTESK
jgi:hypothetical protein